MYGENRTVYPSGFLNSNSSAAQRLVSTLRSVELLHERSGLLRRHHVTYLPALLVADLA